MCVDFWKKMYIVEIDLLDFMKFCFYKIVFSIVIGFYWVYVNNLLVFINLRESIFC